jgi:hypothetical protein
MAVLRLTLAPSQHHSPVGQEHGRTIPLADASPVDVANETTANVARQWPVGLVEKAWAEDQACSRHQQNCLVKEMCLLYQK